MYYQKRKKQEKKTRDSRNRNCNPRERQRVSMTTNGCPGTIFMQQPKQEGNGKKATRRKMEVSDKVSKKKLELLYYVMKLTLWKLY